MSKSLTVAVFFIEHYWI